MCYDHRRRVKKFISFLYLNIIGVFECARFSSEHTLHVFFWFVSLWWIKEVQFSLSATSDCDPMDCSRPGLPVHHQLPEFAQTHVYRVGDAIQPSHPLSSPSPPAPNPSQHQGLFQWVGSSHLAKVLEFQLQHQSFQWIFRTNLL